MANEWGANMEELQGEIGKLESSVEFKAADYTQKPVPQESSEHLIYSAYYGDNTASLAKVALLTASFGIPLRISYDHEIHYGPLDFMGAINMYVTCTEDQLIELKKRLYTLRNKLEVTAKWL